MPPIIASILQIIKEVEKLTALTSISEVDIFIVCKSGKNQSVAIPTIVRMFLNLLGRHSTIEQV